MLTGILFCQQLAFRFQLLHDNFALFCSSFPYVISTFYATFYNVMSYIKAITRSSYTFLHPQKTTSGCDNVRKVDGKGGLCWYVLIY